MAFQEDSELCPISFELRPHLLKAKDDIQIIVEELNRGSNRNLYIIRAVLNRLNPHSFPKLWRTIINEYPLYVSTPKCKKIIFRILNLFIMHKYSKKSVIADFLAILCRICGEQHPPLQHAIYCEDQFIEINGQKSMLTFEKFLVSSYKDIPSLVPSFAESENSSYIQNWIACLTVIGEVDALKVMLSYGAVLILPAKLTNRFMETVILNMDQMYKIHEAETEEEYDHKINSINYNMMHKFDGISIRRLFLVNTVLMCLTNFYSSRNHDDCIQCARIFIESTPEPFISSTEIKIVLSKLYGDFDSNKKMLQIVEHYEFHFPESRESSKPRSLKHLSRFQVRENLRTAMSFPEGVDLLGLPKKIQDYIKDITLS